MKKYILLSIFDMLLLVGCGDTSEWRKINLPNLFKKPSPDNTNTEEDPPEEETVEEEELYDGPI
ncbi:hypothetical protein [Tenuibacillus multivorans]|uniref:Uncharacterized protein n=1 Tax=Tenuibacillus multivorans TaxID=237069 RepID=A0A1H0BP52_9BACI|nr:hypothetical protein [Tenuibacillus multivorans]GEL77088.1 hypothetical protein TMU01_13230 [Tenuibacillus multivorans]SDN47439.1 hypothetical protein SAMN05216498_2333 [Tenuibacillus multivorans]